MGSKRLRFAFAGGLLLLLAACTGDDNGVVYIRDTGAPQPLPANYRAEVVAFLRSYLNDPRGIRQAAIAEPALRTVSDRARYVVCIRFDARDSLGRYAGAKDHAALFLEGRLDRLLPNGPETCAGSVYAPFPELESLNR